MNGPGRMQMHEFVRIELSSLGVQSDRNVKEHDYGQQGQTYREPVILCTTLTDQLSVLHGRKAASGEGYYNGMFFNLTLRFPFTMDVLETN